MNCCYNGRENIKSEIIQTDAYREFSLRLRKFTMQDACIIITDDVTEQFKKYMRSLSEIYFDVDCYQSYYGDIKKIISSFIHYYSEVLDDIIVAADRYINVPIKNEILELMDKTMGINVDRQISFGKDYLPVKTAEERQNYDEVQDMYNAYTQKLCELKQKIERLDKQDKTDAFAKEHFKFALDKMHEIFDFSHMHIALFLVDRLQEIRISLEEIYLRLRNNLRELEYAGDQTMNDLMNTLYDQNKALMFASRQYRKNSVEIAEITRSIEKTRTRMDVFKIDVSYNRLEEEVEYWGKRVYDFNEVAKVLTRLKKDLEDVDKELAHYSSRKCTELPGSKANCWSEIGKNLHTRRELIREKIIEAGKALVTFFGVRGVDRITYQSDIGQYIVDEFNHQIYLEDYGLGIYHLNCKGDFLKSSERARYLFDDYGRYVKNEAGEKIYQVGTCTSEYRLDEDERLRKITKDCGHSEAVNRKCKMRLKDPRDVEVLPDIDVGTLKNCMEPETIKYLWDSFGHILPLALRDVGVDHTNNPIQRLAHKLLHYKHDITRTEIEDKKKEAQEYRENIFKGRKEKAATASKAWKAKQVKRRKPEESDNLTNEIIHAGHVADQQFIESLNIFYS